MKLIEFYADGYKNLEDISISPGEGINIIYGPNAQGKTNLMEAIGLFSGRDKLRTGGDGRNIGFNKEVASIRIKFDDGRRDQVGEIVFARKNKFLLNRVPLGSINEFCGNFCTIAFSPSHLSIVQGEPRLRRKFIDDAISQMKSDYHKYCKQYDRVLLQRNSLLKSMNIGRADTLDVWNLQLARLGTIITIMRQDYVRKIENIVSDIYDGITIGKEKLKIYYQSTVFDEYLDNIYSEDKIQTYLKKLESAIETDISNGFTHNGVHRDDFILKIDDLNVREYGSQGQQRSCVIALKLAEANLLKLISKSEPIILLDDVMSELDVNRQNYILNHVKNNQVFITCCDISNTLNLKNGKIYYMLSGKIKSEVNEKEC